MKHYIKFDAEEFRLEVGGAWFAVTCLLYFAVIAGVVGALLRAVF